MNVLDKVLDSSIWFYVLVIVLLTLPGVGYIILLFGVVGMCGEMQDTSGRYRYYILNWKEVTHELRISWLITIAAIAYEHAYIGWMLDHDGWIMLPIGIIIAIIPTVSVINNFIKISKERYTRELCANNPS